MKIQLELNEEQAGTMMRALELYARIGMGQLHDLGQHPSFISRSYDRQKVGYLLDEVKHAAFSDLHGRGHSYGIRNDNTHESSKEAYDMYQVLRHAMAWNKNPEGHNWSVAFDEPIQFSKQPLVKCEIQG